MIGDAWFTLLMLPAIVVAGFVVFVFALVVSVIGYVDPSSTPKAELSKLLGYIERCDRWVREPRF